VLAIKIKYVDPTKKEKFDQDIKFNGNNKVDSLWCDEPGTTRAGTGAWTVLCSVRTGSTEKDNKSG